MRQYGKTVQDIGSSKWRSLWCRRGLGAVDGMSDREFDALVAAKILKMVPHIPGHCEHCGGRFSHENVCTGCGLANGSQLADAPRGLEQLDRDEILRLKYSGMLSGDPREHFLGSDMERTFGKENGQASREDASIDWRARWDRVNGRDKTVRCPVPVEGPHWTQEAWRNAFNEIGRVSTWLGLPNHIRDEIARIYTNLRRQGKSSGRHRSRKEILAKITYLACVVHGLPRKREDLEHKIRELYGFGFGEIPKEFVKAADFGHVRFSIEKIRKKQYLYTWKMVNGERINHRSLGRL